MAITIHGQGFANYGKGQLVCRMWPADAGAPSSSDVGTLLPAQLLDSQRILCALPAVANASTSYLSVSLNNGTAGSLVSTWLPFVHFARPNVSSVSPEEGDAEGGTLVIIRGSGFAALSADAAVRASLVRVRFGVQGVPVPVLSVSDLLIICRAPWGMGAGPVHVALDGANFPMAGDAAAAAAPTFTFKGLHAPAMVDAYFDAEGAKTLVVKFDAQPTNRANMIGLTACATVLDDTTVAALRGSAPASAPSLCYWPDDSTLVAQLSMHTAASAGMRIGLRPNVLWPKVWAYPGTCEQVAGGPRSMCATASELTVNADFPCDRRDTPATTEACLTPAALATAPAQISSCPGVSASFDGSASTGVSDWLNIDCKFSVWRVR